MIDNLTPLFVPTSVMKTPTPSTDDPAQEDLLQRYQERVEKLSQKYGVIKFCTDAGFLTTVEVGQYFMTKDTEEVSQFTDSAACREYTLPRDENSSEQKGWIRGKAPFSFVGQIFSWLEKIGHGLEQQGGRRQRAGNLWDAVRRICVEDECTCFLASRSKAEAKPHRRTFCQLIHKNYTHWRKNLDRYWTTRWCAHRLFSVEENGVNFLRHGSPHREDDGAIEFWRNQDRIRNHFVHSQHWSDEMWKSTMAKGRGNKKRFQYCTDPSGEILYLRALQGHSGRNLIDPSLQDNVLIPNVFFEYIYHIGCTINLLSIINSGLISGGQNLSKRQTAFFTSVDPLNNEHRDLEKWPGSTASCLVQAESFEETSKHGALGRHQTCSKGRI